MIYRALLMSLLAVGCGKGDGSSPPDANSVRLSPAFDVVAGAHAYGCYGMKIGGTIKEDVTATVSGPEGALFFESAGCGASGSSTLDVPLTAAKPEVAFYFATKTPAAEFKVQAKGGQGVNLIDTSASFPLGAVMLDVSPETPYGIGKCTKATLSLVRASDSSCIVPFDAQAVAITATPAADVQFFSDAACEKSVEKGSIAPGSAHDQCKGDVYLKPSASGTMDIAFKLDALATTLQIKP